MTSNPQVLLHTDEQFKYYKVVAATGTEMHSGAVLRVCEAAGMWAVCPGPCGCTHVGVSSLHSTETGQNVEKI